MAAGERSIPKFAVVKDDDRQFRMETRGSRYGAFAVFMLPALMLSLPAFFGEVLVFRILTGIVGSLLAGLALYVLATAERWDVDRTTGAVLYHRRFMPGRSVRFTRADVAASQVARRTTVGSYSDSRGRRHRSLTTWHTLFVYLLDGRRLELNVSTDLAFLERVHEAVLGEPPPEPVEYSWYRHPWRKALDRLIAPLKASLARLRSSRRPPAVDENERIGRHTVGEWMTRLAFPGAGERVDAAMALSRRPELARHALPVLVRLLDDIEPRARVWAIHGIRAAGVPAAAVPALVRVLENTFEEPEIRTQAAGALGRAGGAAVGAARPALQEALSHADPRLRFEAARVLFDHGAPATESVLQGLTAGFEGDGTTREWAARHIGAIGRPARAAVPALITLLADENADCRTAAANALATMRRHAREAVPALTRCIGDPEADCRIAALRALGSVGPDAAVAVPAIAPVLEDADQSRRSAAVEALRNIGPGAAAAVPALMAIVERRDEDCLDAAIEALGAIGPAASAAVPLLRALTQIPEEGGFADLSASEALESIEGTRGPRTGPAGAA